MKIANKKNFFLLFVLMLFCTGCSLLPENIPERSKDKDNTEKRKNTIISLDVISGAENEKQIYRVQYPFSYRTFNVAELKCESVDLTAYIAPESLTAEDYQYIIDYVDGLLEQERDTKRDLAYYVSVSYYDENGDRQYKSIRGAGGFPDGWAEFTGYINRLCGADYLCAEGEIIKVTPQYLSDVFKITDENIPYETLTAMVNSGQLGLKDITDHTFRIQVEINRYYKESLASVLEPFRPKALETRDCTPEEYDLFVESFLGQIGPEWEEVESDQDKLRRFYHSEARVYFYIGKSMELPDMEVEIPALQEEDEYCGLHLDAHMENMSRISDYFYSADQKYIFVDLSDVFMDGTIYKNYLDVILQFVGEDPWYYADEMS